MKSILRQVCELRTCRQVLFLFVIAVGESSRSVVPVTAQELSVRNSTSPRSISRDVLTENEWRSVEMAVDKGLAFLSRQHRQDGSFQSDSRFEPGVSGLCVMAFISRGHLPGQGPYGDKLNSSLRYFLKCQQSDGLLSAERNYKNSAYNHPICATVLSELYSLSPPKDESQFRQAIEKAIVFSSHRFSQPKHNKADEGSWRYLVRSDQEADGDLSLTSWNVIFLRSAKNAGFTIDAALIEDAVGYMKRLYDPGRKTFRYTISIEPGKDDISYRRAIAGAGVLSMSLAGEHYSEFAQNASNDILKRPFIQSDYTVPSKEYVTYSAFYCSLGMFQMGGEYWSEFYPKLVKTVLKAQRADGSWILNNTRDANFGASYMTALSILALTPPYQMLPIFQR